MESDTIDQKGKPNEQVPWKQIQGMRERVSEKAEEENISEIEEEKKKLRENCC